MRHHLPVLVERVVSDIKASQVQVGSAFETQLRAKSGQLISCRKGCSHCCSHPFLITVAEGLLLYRNLVSTRRWAKVKLQIQEHRELTLGLSFEIWLLSNIPCPLLKEDKSCSVYEARPLHCRVTFSEGDPELCRPHALGVATPTINNVDTIVQFQREVRTQLKRASAQGTLMPVSEAILLAERVETGQIQLSDTDVEYARDLYRGQ